MPLHNISFKTFQKIVKKILISAELPETDGKWANLIWISEAACRWWEELTDEPTLFMSACCLAADWAFEWAGGWWYAASRWDAVSGILPPAPPLLMNLLRWLVGAFVLFMLACSRIPPPPPPPPNPFTGLLPAWRFALLFQTWLGSAKAPGLNSILTPQSGGTFPREIWNLVKSPESYNNFSNLTEIRALNKAQPYKPLPKIS